MRPFTPALLALVLSGGCSDSRWEAFVYHDVADSTRYESIGKFPTLQSCRDAATSVLAKTTTRVGEYKCGRNCDGDLCEETRK